MKKSMICLFILLSCLFCFAEETPDKTVTVAGTDFYYVSLAYKDYSSRGVIFKQDEESVDARINYLKSLKEKYKNPIPTKELGKLSREELKDYYSLQTFESVPEELYREKSFADINEYKFKVSYGKDTVKVYMYIDNPSVRDGDVTYIFDYDGNIISKDYYR
ncbi:MAG: hypothetical protein J6Y60_01610 [Treponema sp.]|nr:hypothetical protein [Treponema sp.]